jgi:hypothetical protein
MTTLEYIVLLIIAIRHNDVADAAFLIDELEALMGPEELANLLEAILGDRPAARRNPPTPTTPVRCA